MILFIILMVLVKSFPLILLNSFMYNYIIGTEFPILSWYAIKHYSFIYSFIPHSSGRHHPSGILIVGHRPRDEVHYIVMETFQGGGTSRAPVDG